MPLLLQLSKLIDAVNERVGRTCYWLILVVVVISAGNAIVRKLFSVGSNAFLEIQWYLFAAVFLLCAGYTLKHNGHVSIDVISNRLSAKTRAIIEIVGGVLFLLPFAILVVYLSWPQFLLSLHETSSDAGGLIRWPVRILIPLGFALLALQGISEIVKRVAFLQGLLPSPFEKNRT